VTAIESTLTREPAPGTPIAMRYRIHVPLRARMRNNEHNTGRADHNTAGTRSSAAGETQEPAKVTDPAPNLDRAPEERSEHQTEASWGSEGSAGAERKPHSSSLERKKNA
jgi:hypothetical protein